MQRACKNCQDYEDCTIRDFARDEADMAMDTFYCSEWDLKEKINEHPMGITIKDNARLAITINDKQLKEISEQVAKILKGVEDD